MFDAYGEWIWLAQKVALIMRCGFLFQTIYGIVLIITYIQPQTTVINVRFIININTGLMKRLSDQIAMKWEKSHSVVMGWVRARLAFAILRATNLCLRGSRVKWRSGHGIAGLPHFPHWSKHHLERFLSLRCINVCMCYTVYSNYVVMFHNTGWWIFSITLYWSFDKCL